MEPLEGEATDARGTARRVRLRRRRAAAADPVAEAARIARLPVARLAAGPANLAAAFGVERADDGARPPRSRRLPAPGAWPGAGDPAREIVATARVGVAYAGPGWADRPWRFVAGRPPAAGSAGLMDAKSIALLEFPLVRERLAAATGFPPGRRLAEALLPSSDPGARRDRPRGDLAGAGPARRAAERGDRGRARRRPAVDRAARGGRLDAVQFAAIAQTLEAASRLRDVLAEDRRSLLHELARSLHPLPGLRSTLERSFDPAGELLDTASPAPRRAAPGDAASPTSGCGHGSSSSSTRATSAAPSRTRSSPSATGAT